MEYFALAEFELQTGHSVERVPWVLRHPEYEWMSCNLDAVIDGTHVGEVKCPGDYVMPDLERLRQGLPVAPMSAVGRYVIQIHHCMEVTGLSSAWLIVLPGTRDPVFVELERNDALCSAIVKAEQDLWARISQGIEPGPRAGDLRDMAKAWRAEHMGEQETADERLVAMFEELDAIRENRRECEAAAKEYKALEDEHVARMGEIAATAGAQKLRVICPDKARSITVVQSRPGLDGKALAKAHPDIHKEFSTKARAPYFKVS
jgi:predicted phage-related endonuclease